MKNLQVNDQNPSREFHNLQCDHMVASVCAVWINVVGKLGALLINGTHMENLKKLR